MANEPENRLIETDVRAASLAQIHAALALLYRGDFVPALSLASAAEGILPETNNPHFFKKLQEWQKLLPPNIGGATGLNDFINWAKHGETADRPSKAVISELEVMFIVQRAISKFVTIYNEQSPQMKAFADWAIERLQPKSKPVTRSKIKARLPRGLADRGPSDIAITRRVTDKIREVYELYGFEAVETPAIEYTETLGKFLPDQDRPNEGVFSFQDDDEQWMSLRYDLTAPLARHVAENFQNLPLPYRSYRFGWVFRNEKPGPGRFRQFMQFDADTVGSASMAADAEMCMMAADTMEALGFETVYVVKVNNRKILDGVLESVGLGGEENATTRLTVLRAIDKLDRLGPEGVRQLLGKGRTDDSGDFTKGAGVDSQQAEVICNFLFARDIQHFEPSTQSEFFVAGDEEALDDGWYYSNMNTIEALSNFVGQTKSGQQAIAELKSIFALTARAGYGSKRIKFDPSVVRGLEYYTGPVYEVELLVDTRDEKGRPVRFGSVGGGGRYDGLISRFRGEPVPATGFSIGVSRLQAAVSSIQRSLDFVRGPVVVTVLDPNRIADYQKMVAVLRKEGIRAELYLGNPKHSVGQQLKYADKRKSPCAIIQGGDELDDPSGRPHVIVKDLRLGAELSKLEQGRAEHLQRQAEAQQRVSQDKMVDAVRAVLERPLI